MDGIQLERIRRVHAVLERYFSLLDELAVIEPQVQAIMASMPKKKTHIGRPRLVVDMATLRTLHRQGLTFREIAARMGLSLGTVERRLAGAREDEQSG